MHQFRSPPRLLGVESAFIALSRFSPKLPEQESCLTLANYITFLCVSCKLVSLTLLRMKIGAIQSSPASVRPLLHMASMTSQGGSELHFVPVVSFPEVKYPTHTSSSQDIRNLHGGQSCLLTVATSYL